MKVELEHLKVLNLSKDSIIIYETDMRLTTEQMDKVGKALKEAFPDNQVVVLPMAQMRVIEKDNTNESRKDTTQEQGS